MIHCIHPDVFYEVFKDYIPLSKATYFKLKIEQLNKQFFEQVFAPFIESDEEFFSEFWDDVEDAKKLMVEYVDFIFKSNLEEKYKVNLAYFICQIELGLFGLEVFNKKLHKSIKKYYDKDLDNDEFFQSIDGAIKQTHDFLGPLSGCYF